MSKIDMAQFGLNGATYHFSDKIRYFQRSDKKKFPCKTEPGKLSAQDMDALGEFLAVPAGQLLEALLEMNDALKGETKKTQRGTKKHVDVTWDDAVMYNAKGDTTGLNYAVIGTLMANDYIRVDDFILKPEHNVAKLVSQEQLTRSIITKLDEVNAANLWTTRSNSLVRDQIMTRCPVKSLGKTAGYLPVKNGVIDLKTMELTQTDEVYLSSATVAYDPDATCPNIDTLLTNMYLPEQRELVLSVLGAAISGRSAAYILCMSGQGRNGKSLMREMLAGLLGELFTAEKIERIHENFVNQAFIGRRVIWQTEVSSKRQFTSVLKDVTGGTTLNIQYKYKNGGLQVELQSVVIIDTNHPPALEQSKAIEERMRFVDMPRTFVHELSGAPNEVLIDRNLAEAWKNELPGFLNILLPYAQHYVCHGKLKYDTGAGLTAYNAKADSLATFLEEACDVAAGLEVTTTTFCKHYKLFAKQHNVSALTDSQIRYQLQKEFNFRVQGMTVYGVRPKVIYQKTITPGDST